MADRSTYEELNPRQRAFVDAYLRTGNASQSVVEAGYTAKPNAWGAQLLAKLNIQAALQERQASIQSTRIMDVQEIQERYTAIARGDEEPTRAQLVALAQLAKRHREFSNKYDLGATDDLKEQIRGLTDEELAERKRRLADQIHSTGD